MLGFYNYTVWLTYVGLVFSVCGMFFAGNGEIRAAVVCLLFSGLCDMFDGKIARTKKDRTDEEKQFGIQIDSLCDSICFGAFPAVIGFCVGANRPWQLLIAAVFVVCGVIRLGYFNVTEEARQKTTNEGRRVYNGLPITTSALLVPLLVSFRPVLGAALPYAYSALLALLAVLYITPFSLPKPGRGGGLLLIAAGIGILLLIILL